MKKGKLSIMLAAALVMAGCSSETAPEETAGEKNGAAISTQAASETEEECLEAEEQSVSGTFEGTAMGMKGEVTVNVVIEDSQIKDVQVTGHTDTLGISDAAIKAMPGRIVEEQNIEADSVTGATMTSYGIRNAVANALEQAGLNVDDFKRGAAASENGEEKQEENYDLVIVGSGMSGLSAAITAARQGEDSVLVLEKEAYTGGSSRVCGGGIWAVDSRLNEEIGQNSTAEELIHFLETRSEQADLNQELLQNIYNGAGDMIEYFYDNGLPVSLETWTLGHLDSKLPVLWSVHNNDQPWETGESRFIDSIEEMTKALDVEIRLESEVTELLADGNQVTGVRVKDPEGSYVVNSKKVILATGGFTRNQELIEQYAPEYSEAFAFTGAGSTGDGITLTKKLGAQVTGKGMMGLMGLDPSHGYYGSTGNLVWLPKVVVNKEGEDFGLTTSFYSETLKLLLDQTDSRGIGIFDSTSDVTDRLEAAAEQGAAKKFNTLEELAEEYDIDKTGLLKTSEKAGLQGDTYYGIVIRPLFIGSIPGLKVDSNCHVLNQSDEPVENLLACGELIFGNVFAERYPASGTGMGISAYSGRLAGETAIAEMRK